MGDLLVLALFVLLFPLAVWSPSAAEWTALALILVAGIPHGAFDLRVAEAKWLPALRSRIAVLALYLIVGGTMSALCLLAPGVGLVFFLLVSVLHFSEGEGRESNRAVAAVFGCGAILCPIGFHVGDATGYLSFFVSPESFTRMAPALEWAARVLFAAAVLLVGMDLVNGRRAECLQRIICLVAWVALPPLAGFAVWFIGRHSRQHLAQCRALFSGSRFGIPIDFVVISVLAVSLIVALSLRFNLGDIHELFAASIILIAGLTLPHMVVSHDLPRTVQRLRA